LNPPEVLASHQRRTGAEDAKQELSERSRPGSRATDQVDIRVHPASALGPRTHERDSDDVRPAARPILCGVDDGQDSEERHWHWLAGRRSVGRRLRRAVVTGETATQDSKSRHPVTRMTCFTSVSVGNRQDVSRTLTALPLTFVALLAAAGCSSSPSSSPPPGSPPPAAASSSPAAASSTPTTDAGGYAPSTPAINTLSTRCSAAHLALQIGGNSAGTGHQVTHLILRNAGTTTCTVAGFPGVSFADETGSPVDKPATRQGPVGHVVTLAPTQVASAVLDTVHGSCTMSNRHDSALVRIFAPGDVARLQTFLPLTLCGMPSTITAMTAGAGGALPGPPASASSPVGAGTCSSTHLALTVSVPQGAAGSSYTELILRNAGTSACRLSGFPGVSLFDITGHQVGKDAQHSGSPGVPDMLAPGQVAHATLRTIPAACTGRTAGSNPGVTVRVFPPGEHGPLTNAIYAYPCGAPQVTAVSPGAHS